MVNQIQKWERMEFDKTHNPLLIISRSIKRKKLFKTTKDGKTFHLLEEKNPVSGNYRLEIHRGLYPSSNHTGFDGIDSSRLEKTKTYLIEEC